MSDANMKIRDYKNIEINGKMKNTYLIYARKSGEGEDKQVESLPAQLKVLRKLARQKNLTVFKELTESASAKALGRHVFSELIDILETNEDIKGIICWKLNRLFRNPVDEGKIRWLLDSNTIEEIVTPTKTYKGYDADFLMAIEGAQAQRFIRDLREDTQRGINNKLEKGHAPILAPAGYVNDTHKRQGEKTISPHPEYFDLVKEIFRLALSGQFSTNALYKKAKSMGIKSNYGKEISKTRMYEMLKSPFYCGKFIYAGKLYQGAHKEMISTDEFDALQEILDNKARAKKITLDFLLRGFIKCGYCNYQIVGERHTKKSGLVFDYYTCSMRKKDKQCIQPYVRTEVLEQQFTKYLERVRLSESFVKWAIKWLNNAEKQDNLVRKIQLKSHTKEYKKLGEQINKLIDMHTSEQMEYDEYISHKQRYIQKRMELNKKIKNFDKDWKDWTDLSIKTFRFASEAKSRWENGTLRDKQLILSIIGSNFVLKDKKLTIQPKTPFLIIEKALNSYQVRNVGSNPVFEPNVGVEDFGSTVLGD